MRTIAYRCEEALEVIPGRQLVPRPWLGVTAAALALRAAATAAVENERRKPDADEVPDVYLTLARRWLRESEGVTRRAWIAVEPIVQNRARMALWEKDVSAAYLDSRGRLFIIRRGADPRLDALLDERDLAERSVSELVAKLLR